MENPDCTFLLYLWHKNKAEGGGGAEDDEDGDHDEGSVLLVGKHEGDGGAHDTHEDNVVDAHADILGVVERGDADMPRLPCQERAEYLWHDNVSNMLQVATMTICFVLS